MKRSEDINTPRSEISVSGTARRGVALGGKLQLPTHVPTFKKSATYPPLSVLVVNDITPEYVKLCW
jgi:hypothetical protein